MNIRETELERVTRELDELGGEKQLRRSNATADNESERPVFDHLTRSRDALKVTLLRASDIMQEIERDVISLKLTRPLVFPLSKMCFGGNARLVPINGCTSLALTAALSQ